MLTIPQGAEITRGITSVKYLTAQKDVFKDYIPLNNLYIKLEAKVKLMEIEAGLKETDSAPGTATKSTLKKRCSKNLSTVLDLTQEYYKGIDDKEMADKVHVTQSNLFDIKDGEFTTQVQKIIKDIFTVALMADTVFITYQVTPAKIAAIATDAILFEARVGDAKIIGAGSTTANDTLNTAISEVHQIFVSMDNLMSIFEETNPKFVSDYHINTALDIKGTRHTGIEGIVYKNGRPYSNAQVRFVGTDKVATTDAAGHYTIISIRPGTYSVLVSNESGDSLIKEVRLRRGIIETINFDLA